MGEDGGVEMAGALLPRPTVPSGPSRLIYLWTAVTGHCPTNGLGGWRSWLSLPCISAHTLIIVIRESP